jgi:hypothetical protein
LAEGARLGLEGIVEKRKYSPYRSGTRSGWIKAKTGEWKAANQYRAKLFEKSPPDSPGTDQVRGAGCPPCSDRDAR